MISNLVWLQIDSEIIQAKARFQLISESRFLIGGLKPNKPPVLPGETKTLVYEKITSDDRMVVVW